MLLACDIGNTRIKSAIFEDKNIINFRIAKSVNGLIKAYKNTDIAYVAFSSVVPKSSKEFIRQIKKIFNIVPFQINQKSKFNLRIDYQTPETLGIDRICSAEGAFYLFKRSNIFKDYQKNDYIISIDFGTATTLNFIKYPGVFTGGIITPGIGLMSQSLYNQTAQLPKSSFSDYKNLIGKDTKSAIASGIINSAVGLIERSIRLLRAKHNARKIHIYITGGNSPIIAPHLKFKNKQVNELVLIGIKAVFEKNAGIKL